MNGESKILVGDVREKLKEIPVGSVQTCITSPPYWGLRDYGVEGQIGSEKTPEEFIATMVDVFRLVRDTLRDDGTLWVNLGDSYSASPGQRKTTDKVGPKQETNNGSNTTGSRSVNGFQAGSQLLMPHRVALALQADGWILRSTVIWHKRSPMPESISGWRWVKCRVKVSGGGGGGSRGGSRGGGGNGRPTNVKPEWLAKWSPCPGCDKCRANDGWILRKGKWRPTTAHEYVFLFSKSEKYYCDGDAVAEVSTSPLGPSNKQTHKYAENGQRSSSFHDMVAVETRNPRSVWTLSHEPYREAHFATYPTELVRRMLLATSPAECCSKCGTGYAPAIQTERIPTRPGTAPKEGGEEANRDPERHVQRTSILGYRPTCSCKAPAGRAIVLDPFGGSGTTAQVAVHYGRDAIICELNEKYVGMAEKRIATWPKCKPEPKKPKKERQPKTKPKPSEPMLWDELLHHVAQTGQEAAQGEASS